jgi:hypothetical protein
MTDINLDQVRSAIINYIISKGRPIEFSELLIRVELNFKTDILRKVLFGLTLDGAIQITEDNKIDLKGDTK